MVGQRHSLSGDKLGLISAADCCGGYVHMLCNHDLSSIQGTFVLRVDPFYRRAEGYI